MAHLQPSGTAMSPATATAILFPFLVALFAALVGSAVLGFRVARRRRTHGDTGFGKGTTAVTGSLFALLGLLIAFTIAGGENRLDARRHLILEEANAIGTAYLRLDLLPAAMQPQLRDDFRRYVDARIAITANIRHIDQARAAHQRADELQQQLWRHAIDAVAAVPDTRPALLLVPAINAMLDVTTARDAALRTHVPPGTFALLLALALACSFFAGADMAKSDHPSRLHLVMFAATLALTCFVIVNVELPRLGFAGLRQFDALLVKARQQMN